MEIYKITNLINNKIYIGKDTTCNPNYFGSGLIIKRSLKKYGKENFIKEVIDETDNYDELSKKEIYWISKYESNNPNIGYNISPGGDGGDTLSNHPDLDLIKTKISKNSLTRGKTYEEAFGEEKAKLYKLNLSKSNARHNLGKTYDELYGTEIANQVKKLISINTTKNWTEDRKKIQSDLGKTNIYNSLLSEESIIKNREYLNNRWINWKEKERIFIDDLLEKSNIDELTNYLNRIPNSLFDSRKKFYEFIGYENFILIKEKLLIKNPNKHNQILSNKIIIDNVEYNSIYDATKKLNIDRSVIRYRLKSSHFKNYLYKNNELNIKYNKFIKIDPHFSKKERVSIDGIEYNSITEACNILDKTGDYINWRLNSKSYPEWFYLNKEIELKETGNPKMKRVSILGNSYESISMAVIGSGVDRQIMRHRLKSKKYIDYFYI